MGGRNTICQDQHRQDAEELIRLELQEMVLIYPTTIFGIEEEIRTEFVNSMMRSQTKAQRDAVIATGLIPVSSAIGVLAIVI